jgi:E3 ubiquitin-protein ligase TRIP12
VHLLNSEHNPDIMLLAARALTFLADVLPSSCSSIVRHGAVPAFCARLLTIEYIDLAEQSLQVGCPVCCGSVFATVLSEVRSRKRLC